MEGAEWRAVSPNPAKALEGLESALPYKEGRTSDDVRIFILGTRGCGKGSSGQKWQQRGRAGLKNRGRWELKPGVPGPSDGTGAVDGRSEIWNQEDRPEATSLSQLGESLALQADGGRGAC